MPCLTSWYDSRDSTDDTRVPLPHGNAEVARVDNEVFLIALQIGAYGSGHFIDGFGERADRSTYPVS